MNNNLTNDQQRLINMYINQYNTTNSHIEHLLDMLDEIRSNIFNVITLSQPRRARINRHSRNSNTHINRIINQMFNDRQNNYIHYDYNRPINRNIYNENINRNSINRNNINNNNINNNNINPNISSSIFDSNELTNFLTNFLNTTVPIRPTQGQIEDSSRLIRYSSIETPLSERCPISLERFSNEEMVRQLKPCGHLFCQASFQQWFENNVRCPVCRYDIRNYRDNTQANSQANSQANEVTLEDVDENSDQEQSELEQPEPQQTNNFSINRNPVSNQIDNIVFDITNSEMSSNIVNNLATRLFQTILSPQLENQNNDTIMYDASNNMLFYETILRPPSRNQNNRQI
jgi:hypothetical protein